jgi:hypothetical protein
MKPRKPLDLDALLVVESFQIDRGTVDQPAATTYITAVLGNSCYHLDETNCGPQLCNPHTDVCF